MEFFILKREQNCLGVDFCFSEQLAKFIIKEPESRALDILSNGKI